MARKVLIGLDIDSSSVRMVQLRRRQDKYTVVGAAVRDIVPTTADPDQRRANTIQAISSCLDELERGGRFAVCGLRGPEVVVRGFEFPSLPPEEVEGAVGLQTSQICPFDLADGACDYQVTSDSDTKTRGFWVAATRELIESKRRIARDSGLQCVLMDIDGLALLNCLDHWLGHGTEGTGDNGDIDDNIARPAVLNIGGSFATIAIVDNANRPFVRDVSTAEHEIVRRIASQTRQSIQAVRAALLDEAPPDVDISQRTLETACLPLLEAIVTTLRYYTAENRNTEVDRLLVCGHFALARGFMELLDSALPFEVLLWNPIAHIRWNVDERCEAMLQRMGSSMVVATGLAMRAI